MFRDKNRHLCNLPSLYHVIATMQGYTPNFSDVHAPTPHLIAIFFLAGQSDTDTVH